MKTDKVKVRKEKVLLIFIWRSTISHDLNNLLTTLQQSVDVYNGISMFVELQ